jgi:hypothetical protein
MVLAVGAIARPAHAGCVEFRETAAGDATLINHCDTVMDVGYLIADQGASISLDAHVYRSAVKGDSSVVLWSRGSAPIQGKYQIKVYACPAPLSLVLPKGGRPVCQIDYASAG